MSYLDMYFEYDGCKCTEFGLYLVRVNQSGLMESPFGVNQSIIEDTTPYNDMPYHYGVKREPLVLDLQLAKMDHSQPGEWTTEDRKNITQWLFGNRDEYKKLVLADHPEIVFYCIPIGDSRRFFNGNAQGYVTLQVRCDAPSGWSLPQVDLYDEYTSTPSVIEINNLSNIDKCFFPEVEFTISSGTTFSLKNFSDGGRIFSFTGLAAGETVYANNQIGLRNIASSTGLNRLGNFNKNWFRLVQGTNRIEITGNYSKLEIRSQFPIAL
jgi:phage-related protein